MATRQEIYARKEALKRALRQGYQTGALRSGSLAPSKRQLAREWDVSASAVAQVMQELVEERLFHTIARSGTFVGAPAGRAVAQRERYLFLGRNPDHHVATALVRMGFEDRIAGLGGSVLAVNQEQVEECVARTMVPPAAGAFGWGSTLPRGLSGAGASMARACYATLESEAQGDDSVAFDDVDGGQQATGHLLRQGHRAIAFLGLHQDDDAPSGDSGPPWSRLRERGWRQSLNRAGWWREGLAFRAARAVDWDSARDQFEAAREAARRLMSVPVDAVVTANDAAARALLDELRSHDLAPSRWPAIVSFDNDPALQSEAITSLRLPWEEIGRIAADLLWERAHGELSSDAQHRLVKMRLIPRLTCQPDWARASSSAVHAARLLEAPVVALSALER